MLGSCGDQCACMRRRDTSSVRVLRVTSGLVRVLIDEVLELERGSGIREVKVVQLLQPASQGSHMHRGQAPVAATLRLRRSVAACVRAVRVSVPPSTISFRSCIQQRTGWRSWPEPEGERGEASQRHTLTQQRHTAQRGGTERVQWSERGSGASRGTSARDNEHTMRMHTALRRVPLTTHTREQ